MTALPEQATTAAATRASGSNFYLAMRILPKMQREGMYQIYSFCRLVDDIADGDAPRPVRIEQLEQ
jgi:phytoene synthase